jgi:serpin B
MKSLTFLWSVGLLGLAVSGCNATADVAQNNQNSAPDASQPDFLRSNNPAVTNPAISDTDYASFIADSNRFGLELYQKVNASTADKNSVFSPVSAELALAMAYGGATDAAAAAMKATLHDNLAMGQYHVACNRLQRDLLSRNYSHDFGSGNVYRIELAPANSLWIDLTFSVKTPFLDLLSEQYDTGTYRVNFAGEPEPSRLAINGWVMDRTHNKIKDLLNPGDVDSGTRAVLVNALYFFGNWSTLFNKQSTQPGIFHTLAGTDVTANLMHGGTEEFNYKADANATVLQVPYVHGDLWMTIVLPNSGQFASVRDQVSQAWLAQMTASLAQTSVQVTIPKFTITTDQIKLRDPLIALGMGPAFVENFTGISNEPISISDVVQKAFIGVDEEGTEAAAATAVMFAGAVPQQPIPVTVDRPFLYFIQDTTGIVLFAGQVVDPTL